MNVSLIRLSIFVRYSFSLQLAESMLPLFDPTVQPSAMSNGKDASLVPVFKEPKIYSGLLPGTEKRYILSAQSKYLFTIYLSL